MNARYFNLHAQLCAEIAVASSQHQTEHQKIETCFQAAQNYWKKVKTEMDFSAFENEQEEIFFFKTVKPLFTGKIELFTLIYQSILLRPLDIELVSQFWQKELKKIARFTEMKKEFISYFQSDETHLDKKYFLRRGDALSCRLNKVYDKDSRYASSHDSLIAEMLALKDYNIYIQQQVAAETVCLLTNPAPVIPARTTLLASLFKNVASFIIAGMPKTGFAIPSGQQQFQLNG